MMLLHHNSFLYFTDLYYASEDENIAIGHNHDHDHKDEGNRRIDNEIVRELVDCGGSDLGFCDMNSRYPGYGILSKYIPRC